VPAYQPWSEDRAASIIDAAKHLDGASLPILHALQAEFGHVPTDAVPMVAHALNLSRAEVHGIVTFYHEFRRTPPGRHVLHVCRAEACQSVGGHALAEYAKERLGVDWHGATVDGTVTLEPVFCLGLCAIGPAGMLDGQPLAHLTAASLDKVLERVA
jgi:formate dehydrogenase subunit gamma